MAPSQKRPTPGRGRLRLAAVREGQANIPAWKHALRVILAFLWVAVLTIWCFRIYSFVLFHDSTFYGALAAVAVLRGLRWLWFIAFVPSLAFGIVAYGLSCLSWRDVFHGLPDRALERAEIVGGACFAICLWAFLWRLAPIPALFGTGSFVTEPVERLLYGTSPSGSAIYPLLTAVAVLGVGASLAHAWNALGRAGVDHRLLVGFFVVTLGVGGVVPAVQADRFFADAIPRQLYRMPQALRETLVAGDEDPGRLDLVLARYLWTHHPPAERISIRDNDIVRGDPAEACSTCQLPLTILATLTGITVRIGDEGPRSARPDAILEIPLGGDRARIYDVADARYVRTVDVEELEREEIPGDWWILKVDAGLRATKVHELLRGLRHRGVRQVTLSAVPWNYAPPPARVPRLTLDAVHGVTLFRPRQIGRRPIVIVRKYVPPPPGGSTPGCYGPDRHELRDAVRDWEIPAPNSLPPEVAIETTGDFQDFIIGLDRALAGDAHVVGLFEEPARP